MDIDGYPAPLEFKGLRSGDLVLELIEQSDLTRLDDLIDAFDEADYFREELHRSYAPVFDKTGMRTKYGFSVLRRGELAGFCLLGVDSWKHRRAHTGADTFPHMRGRGIAPASKPLLFYLAFELLKLNRVETGCATSNLSSRKSIEKTRGFELEGVLRGYCLNQKGGYDDEFRYSILREDWLRLYEPSEIEVIA